MDTTEKDFFGKERIGRILLKMAPPVMLAQLIQALYNIVDSFFVGKYSENALTALTVIYPLQLIIIALAVGTGVGVNTYMARKYAQGKSEEARKAAGTGMVLELVTWAVFAAVAVLIMKPYVMLPASSTEAIQDAVTYGNIVCIGSIGVFLEGNWTKVHQAHGNMRLPMAAQIAGAAYATICGQITAAVITGIKGWYCPTKPRELLHYAKRIYFYGYSSIVMQGLYTVYIFALNVILAGFSDAAVTVLGLYYKLQSFFFIPLFGLQTCIVPILSFNYARAEYKRCRLVMRDSFGISLVFMILGIIGFIGFPELLIRIFSTSEQVITIGIHAFPIIGLSFIPAVFSLMMPVFFQAIGEGGWSLFLSLLRQIACLVPIFCLFSLIGLDYTWLAFPVSEVISGGIGLLIYTQTVKKWKAEAELQ